MKSLGTRPRRQHGDDVGEIPICCAGDDEGNRNNKIRHLNRGAAPDGDSPLPGGAQCGSG